MSDKKTDRRSFLKMAGLGAAGTAAVMSGSSASKASGDAPGSAGGYTETDHIRKFYELARF